MTKTLFTICFSLIFLLASQTALAKRDLCSISSLAAKEASKVRGLRIKRDVPCSAETKDQVRSYILRSIEEKLPPQRLQNEEVVYQALGMIPPRFNYKEGMVKLYTDQIGGFYDPSKKRYVMAAWMPSKSQMPIAVHEMVHALQDQHFSLKDKFDVKKYTSDRLLAHAALIEGDATAVVIDFSRVLMGQGKIQDQKDVDGVIAQTVISSGLLTRHDSIPYGLKLKFVFPYTVGLSFAHQLLKKGGHPEVDRAFKKLPRSSEEILHPKKYFSSKADFVTPQTILPASMSQEHPPLFEDTLGEFGITALLCNFIADEQKAANSAAGWGGDLVSLFEDNSSHYVTWTVNWDSKKDAKEFLDSFRDVLASRSKSKKEFDLNQNITLEDDSVAKITQNNLSVVYTWKRSKS